MKTPMTLTEKIANARETAMAKVHGWCRVQTRAMRIKEAARRAGDTVRAARYMAVEFRCSARRNRASNALGALERLARDAA